MAFNKPFAGTIVHDKSWFLIKLGSLIKYVVCTVEDVNDVFILYII